MPSYIRQLAQELRKNATKEENHLWYDFLKTYPVQFRRQVPFDRYIVDFYCAKANLAIELDGSQHYTDEGKEYDAERTEYLSRAYGVRMIRFSNLDIARNFRAVCDQIHQAVHQSLPPAGGKVARPQGRDG